MAFQALGRNPVTGQDEPFFWQTMLYHYEATDDGMGRVVLSLDAFDNKGHVVPGLTRILVLDSAGFDSTIAQSAIATIAKATKEKYFPVGVDPYFPKKTELGVVSILRFTMNNYLSTADVVLDCDGATDVVAVFGDEFRSLVESYGPDIASAMNALAMPFFPTV